MANNQLTLAFANDAEISAFGFGTIEEAVLQYSSAAADGFTKCRFVATGLQDTITGVLDDEYVIVITGLHQLVARIGKFGDRPSNLRGWLLFSNSNYFLGELDLVFGSRGGTTIYTDNYLCGSNGLPVCPESSWEFKDYFGELDEIVHEGVTYVKAWNVEREPLEYKKQNLLAIKSITWCGELPHALADGATLKEAPRAKKSKIVVLDKYYQTIHDNFGAPYIINGKNLCEIVANPIFCHALVKCHCGKTSWTVGDWGGYKSMCCNVSCKPLCVVNGDVYPGDVLITSTDVATSGLKYYNGMLLKFVDTVDGCHVWRIQKIQSVNNFVASPTYDSGTYAFCDNDVCSPKNNTIVAREFKYGVFSGAFTDNVRAAICQGDVDVGTAILSMADNIVNKPWFVREMSELLDVAWNAFLATVKMTTTLNSTLRELAQALSKATLRVRDGVIEFLADVPACFKTCFDTFRDFVITVFELTVNVVKIAGKNFRAVGSYVLLNNAIVKFVTVKVRGLHQAGVKTTQYATTVVGTTTKVKSKRLESSTVNLTLVDKEQPIITNGHTVVIGGKSFFYSGGFYRLMCDYDTVLNTPVFKAHTPIGVVFKCTKPTGFVDPVCDTLEELVSNVTGQLLSLHTPYRFYDVKVVGEQCVVTCNYTFRAPSYITDVDAFVAACTQCIDYKGFDSFYINAHAATSLTAFVPLCEEFEQFKEPVCCPAVLRDIDGGKIWNTFISTVSDAIAFVKSLKIDFTLAGIVMSATKRFKRYANALMTLYREFVATVTKTVNIGSQCFTYYAFNVPKLVIAGVLHSVGVFSRGDVNVAVQDVVVEFNVIEGGSVPITPTRVEAVNVTLEECDYKPLEQDGIIAVVDGYTFYNKGDYYYPSDLHTAVPICYKRGSGIHSVEVQFSDTVEVKEIAPVYRVKLEYEFEDPTIKAVCDKVIGPTLKFEGDNWDAFCDYINTVMMAVSDHLTVPQYYIYDEEGGTDLEKPVMISQWPITDDGKQSPQSCETVDAPLDVDCKEMPESDLPLDVKNGLSFIVDQPSTFTPDPFSYEHFDVSGLRVLCQDSNNCWVASALVQLQLLDCYESTEYDLFKVGRVGSLVRKCYELTGSIKGAMGDTSYCLEALLRDMHTMFIRCITTCDCGEGSRELSGAVFRFIPNGKPFSYGGCPDCGKPLMHTIVSMQGTGVFCQDPKPLDVNTLLVQPICASVFLGSVMGHYKTNIYTHNVCVDGNGVSAITYNTINTLCYKDVNYVAPTRVKPFVQYKNVSFYQGAIADLLSVEHDFIVNAANENLSHGGGVAAAINTLTGGVLQTLSDHYVKTNGKIKVGDGIMLHCGAEHVYNVVGPRKGKHAAGLLVKAYTTTFANVGVPLTPLLSVGIFKVPLLDSLKAMLDVAGDKQVNCFCYTDAERDAIMDYVGNLTQDVVTVEEPTPIKPTPYRVEGKFQFYDAPVDGILSLQPDRLVFFTNVDLKLCSVANAFDTQFGGALAQSIAGYLGENPGGVPAGNLLTFKCEGAVTVSFAVLPREGDANFEKNVMRTLNKVAKLKGSIVATIPDLGVLRRMLKCCETSFVVSAHTRDIVSECFAPAIIPIKVSIDGRDVHDVLTDSTIVLNDQVGACSVANRDMTGIKPDDTITDVVSVAPDVDWISYYGFPRADVFHTLDHSGFAYESKEVNGIRVLKLSDNNCWINATCIQLQFAKTVFKSEGLQSMWDAFLIGDTAKFVHWLYWYLNLSKGQPGDVEQILGKISRYMACKGSVVLARDSDCCSESRTVSTPVVEASLLRSGSDDGYCKHGNPIVSRVKCVKGTVIVTHTGEPAVYPRSALLSGITYTTYSGSMSDGHYTVFATNGGRVYDGDSVSTNNELSTRAATSIVITNRVFEDPVARVETKATTVIESLDNASEKFFSFGDIASRNCIAFVVWLFSMLSILFKACKTRDVKVFAMAPQRTGVILSRSIKYNCKASFKLLTAKTKWVLLTGKLLLSSLTMYAFWFLLVRFGPLNDVLCTTYVEGYSHSNFDKNDYCHDVVCRTCLYGYQELSDLPHTLTTWTHIRDPLFKSILPFLYMAFLLIFGGVSVRISMLYFVAQYINQFGVMLGVQDNVWLLQCVPFSIFGDEIVVTFLVVRLFMFVKHILMGCDKPSCIACSRSARLQRIPLQTIVNGANRSFYVFANGGKKFCNKHNFFCLNCDSYGSGCTFINDTVASEVSNVTKTNVVPTGPAFVEIDKVEFNNGFYYLYASDGTTFWRYNYDITESKYSCKEVLKSCNVLSDFIVYNNTGSNVTQVKNACVYFSQLLCKPIKLVDVALLNTLNVDFNGALHSAFVEVLTESFGKDLSSCTTMSECKKTLAVDTDDEDFVNCVTNAHKFNVLMCDLSYNNLITSYAKPEEKLSSHDLAACVRGGARVVNHNVVVKENVPIVWLAKDFNALSDEGRKYIVKTAKLKGVNFMLTFNDNRMQTSIPVVSIMSKQGSGIRCCYNVIWWLCVFVLCCYLAVGLVDYSTTVTSASDYVFKYIEGGKLYNFDKPLSCVHNVFDNFDNWFSSKFGFVPTNSKHCPIVVGVSNEGRTVPGIPSNVFLFGKTLIFVVQAAFGDSNTCYDINGPAPVDRCVFSSACTVLNGLGGLRTYCYKNGLIDGASLYTDIQPHSYYSVHDGGYIRLPEVLASGLGFRTVRTFATTYCRMGECVDSKAGVCFGSNRFLVYNAESGADFVCGTGLLSLMYNLLSVFSTSFSIMAMSGQIVFNSVVAAAIVLGCMLVTKFKRIFGDMSVGVCTVICAAFINNISYIVTQNVVTMISYSVLYFLCTRTFKYAWIWHLGYCVAYGFMAPWWLVAWYMCAALSGLVPSLLKLKVTTQLFDGEKFVGTFETAASGTFVLDMHSYQRLVNSIAPEKVKQYAASYNKYKYYSGSASEADYRLACYAHLAKAMMDFGTEHRDLLYTPPTISYNSTLQSGLRIMAQPSGLVEKCIVRVCYGNMVLNGVWLGDTVICPRHILAQSTTTTIDYDHAYSVMRLHNFSISVGNAFLGVVSAIMKGTNLYIKVNQTNVNTPEHCFKTVKQGESFNVLACYDGTPSGVYGVTLRTNYTIRGSFINGACGSPGYNINNGKVEFCYLHQLELGSGCHVGSTFEGVMYGNFEDQPTLQVEGANHLVTVNVMAFLYGALLNGITWFINGERVNVEAFNEWASSNGFTAMTNVECFAMLAAKTGFDVPRLLAAIQRLHKGFGGKNILGYTTLTDEFTVSEVIRQMYGVTLQSTRVAGTFCNLAIIGLFVTMFWSELLHYTTLFWVSPGFITPIFFMLLFVSFTFMLLLKHKVLFLYTFLIPAVIVTSCYNFAWDWYIMTILVEMFDYHVSIVSLDIQGLLNVCVCVFVTVLHTTRFFRTNTSSYTYLLSVIFTILGLVTGADLLCVSMTVLFNFTSTWYVGAIVFKLAYYIQAYTGFASFLGYVKSVMLLYVVLGYFCCTYYGFLYWINRFFKLTLGVYDFKVSTNEFKYMVANGLQAPRGVFDSAILSMKLLGIGGEKTIKVSAVQSKLTDIKCTNVVLLGCLSSMNIASNTKEWAYCVDLHNKINLCSDAETAQELLLALLAFFLSKQADFGVDELLDSYFADSSILQSVASTFVSMPSFIAYENARQAYEEAINTGVSPQLVKQLKRAMNIAKSEFDHEASVQKKISRMAEQAAAQMYKEARAVNRKSKVISAMHSLLFGMLRRLDMSSVETILSLARDGVVPLSIIPAASATKLTVVSADLESYHKICKEGCVHYAGVVWSVIDIRDNDGKIVHVKEITQENVEQLAWPLFLNCERIVKLQNNEIMPGKLKQRAVKAEGDGFSSDGKALYNNEGGSTFMYAFIADKADLKYVKWEFDGGCKVIELETPCKFAVETTNGVTIKYLYFVKNLNTLRRGAVLGYIGATVRLQAGKQTELAINSPLLTMCAFAVDPAKTYVDAVKRGVKPVGNCIKMLSNGAGSGQAITTSVEANTHQDSYGGASVCLYCRAHVEHPTMDGFCKFKGKYVQVPLGTVDPIRFCLENDTCKVCMCWLNNGCTCDRVSSIQSMDSGYLNELGALVQLD